MNGWLHAPVISPQVLTGCEDDGAQCLFGKCVVVVKGNISALPGTESSS